MKTLIIVGAGGHGQVCADIAERLALFERVTFSDNAHKRGHQVGGWRVDFHDDDLSEQDPDTCSFILGVGQVANGRAREMLFSRIMGTGIAPTILVAPDASVPRHASIGAGTLIGFMGIVNIGAVIGTNVIVNTRALIEHDAAVGDHVHVSTGAIVNGGACVGDRCMIGSGAIVLQGVSVCQDVTVGAGAVVTRDIVTPGTYVGVPARKIHD